MNLAAIIPIQTGSAFAGVIRPTEVLLFYRDDTVTPEHLDSICQLHCVTFSIVSDKRNTKDDPHTSSEVACPKQ